MVSLVALILVGLRAVLTFFNGRRRTPRQA
jgi:hypothetical protein